MPHSNAKNFGPWSSANNRQLGASAQHPGGSSFGYSSIGQGLGVQTINGAIVAAEQPQQRELHLDAQECDQVFKVFDKQNTGEIHIGQVQEILGKFEAVSCKGARDLQLQEVKESAGGPAVHSTASKAGRDKKSSVLFANGHHVIGSREYLKRDPQSRGLGNGETPGKAYSPTKRPLHNGSTIGTINGASPNTGIQLRNGL